MKEAPSSSETSFLQEPHGVTSQKTPFFKKQVIGSDEATNQELLYRED
jgi:hypothetical protein